MLRRSSNDPERVLTIIGSVVVLCIALAVTLIVVNPFGGRPENEFSIAITTPYVGQGVEAGTAVVLHGVKVGQVTNVAKTPGGGVRLDADLQTEPVRGLTDAMNIDYRPINYFGVSGINLLPNPAGQALRDGSHVSTVPTGNFTLSQLLSQLGDVSASALTPQLIKVIDRVTRYTDGLNPMFQTAVTMVRAVDAVQTVPTEQLTNNLSDAVAVFPPFTDAALRAGRRFVDFSYYPGLNAVPAELSVPKLDFPFLENAQVENFSDFSEDYFWNVGDRTTSLMANGLFASFGKILTTHVDSLFPLVTGLKSITDIGPAVLRPQDLAQKLAELRSRFTNLYAGNDQQRAVSVRILLDSLPGVAAPIGIVTGGAQ